MQHLVHRKELYPITLEDGHRKLFFNIDLEKEENTMLFSFFNELKVPIGYCVNPERLANLREL